MTIEDKRQTRKQILLIVCLLLIGYAVLLWFHVRPSVLKNSAINSNRETTTAASPAATPTHTVTAASSPSESPAAVETPGVPGARSEPPGYSETPFDLQLLIPVTGVRPDQLVDTFKDARSEARVHDAIDIMAPAGTPVVAAADGEIMRLFQSERGGITIYQLSADKKFLFYYAHLQSYADGLVIGKFAKQGEVIAYVGDTGNAGTGNFHLHFSIAVVTDPKRYWEGTNINPFPLLRK